MMDEIFEERLNKMGIILNENKNIRYDLKLKF